MIGGTTLKPNIVDRIIFCSWFFFLFGLWLMGTLFFGGTSGQWWSVYRLNPGEAGPWALDISYVKMGVAGLLSLLISYIIVRFLPR
jgi:hypothetical protein